MGPALVFFIQKRKIGGHASAVWDLLRMQFSTNFRPPKTAPPRQKIDKNRRKIIKNCRKMHKNHKKMKILQKIKKNCKKT
jgi:lipoate-protein ligase A